MLDDDEDRKVAAMIPWVPGLSLSHQHDMTDAQDASKRSPHCIIGRAVVRALASMHACVCIWVYIHGEHDWFGAGLLFLDWLAVRVY